MLMMLGFVLVFRGKSCACAGGNAAFVLAAREKSFQVMLMMLGLCWRLRPADSPDGGFVPAATPEKF